MKTVKIRKLQKYLFFLDTMQSMSKNNAEKKVKILLGKKC